MIKDFGIYVHIPFCEKKCKYCNFVSSVCDKATQDDYFLSLEDEISSVKLSNVITSIYFGGGTPSVVDSKKIVKILTMLKLKYNISKNAEISIECNPNSATKAKILDYKKAGFNRISFGGQSFDNDILKILGRLHNVNQIFQAIKNAKEVGFDNINLDLIIGIKKLNLDFEKNIKKVKDLGVTHISCYMLIIEDNTPIKKEISLNKVKILDSDDSVAQYNFVLKVLKNIGFKRYEISNFSLPNFQCKHNQNYWQCGEYLGLGVSAHSYINNKRFSNTENLKNYIEKKDNGINIEVLNKEQKLEEYIMLGLRTTKGLKIKKLEQLGYNFTKKQKEIDFLQKNKFIKITKNFIKITPKNFGVCNEIILKLI